MPSRFNKYAAKRADAQQYVWERASQVLANGLVPAGDMEYLTHQGVEWACRLRLRLEPIGPLDIQLPRGHKTRPKQEFQLLYVYAPFRGTGASLDPPLVERMRDFPIVHFYYDNDTLWGYDPDRYASCTEAPPHTLWPEYETIEEFYGGRRAERSGIYYMRHIDEGLAVMARMKASEAAMRAFCLHPLFQADKDFQRNFSEVPHRLVGELKDDEMRSVMLAVEYRAWANRTLSGRVGELRGHEDIPLPPSREVVQMLVADKVQNYKDFLLHHAQTHPRRRELDRYFRLWLKRLKVGPRKFADLFRFLQVGGAPQPLPTVVG